MDRYPQILGCLLGTAVGDSVGLSREGLSRARSERMYGQVKFVPNLAMRLGFYSDDTEHAQITARALAISRGDSEQFAHELGRDFKRWLLTLPAGVGFATLRACLKLLFGFQPNRSGVFSAGNGPAMRSAIIGVVADSDRQTEELVEKCTRLTHTDPKAFQGALLIAQAARLAICGKNMAPAEFLEVSGKQAIGQELKQYLSQASACLNKGWTPSQFADAQGWSQGISGYINHTVPAALYCWARYPKDFRKCIEQAVLLGGDSDTVASIAGSICGAHLGYMQIPNEWLSSIVFWPRSRHWHEQLARSCAKSDGKIPKMRWLATIPRNLLFALLVVAMSLRRLFPPY